MIRCQNGDVVRAKDQSRTIKGRYLGDEHGLRQEISRSCRKMQEPFCPDKSDVTPETCAWACLSSICVGVKKYSCETSWSCPGEARCIARTQVCDGVRDCANGQDEDENLCTEDFCKNGFVSQDNNKLNFTTWNYETDATQLRKSYLFLEYRYPHATSNNIEYYRDWYTAYDSNKNSDVTIIANLQNWATPKCNHSTKCLRRSSLDDDSDHWIEC